MRSIIRAAVLALLVAGAAEAGAPAPPAAPESPAKPVPDPIAARIRYLHERLRITPAQEPLWSKVADAIRANARAVAPLVQQRLQTAATADAPDILKSYETLGAAQLDGLKAVTAAFDPLYQSLSADQKKIADAILRQGPLASLVGGLPEVPPALGLPYVAVPEYVPPPPVVYPLYALYPAPWYWVPPVVPLFLHRPAGPHLLHGARLGLPHR